MSSAKRCAGQGSAGGAAGGAAAAIWSISSCYVVSKHMTIKLRAVGSILRCCSPGCWGVGAFAFWDPSGCQHIRNRSSAQAAEVGAPLPLGWCRCAGGRTSALTDSSASHPQDCMNAWMEFAARSANTIRPFVVFGQRRCVCERCGNLQVKHAWQTASETCPVVRV